VTDKEAAPWITMAGMRRQCRSVAQNRALGIDYRPRRVVGNRVRRRLA
jgi:hypothetical protein